MDFAEEEVDDDSEDPKEEVIDDIVVCLLAFVGHGVLLPADRVSGWGLLRPSECRFATRECVCFRPKGARIRRITPEKVFVTGQASTK